MHKIYNIGFEGTLNCMLTTRAEPLQHDAQRLWAISDLAYDVLDSKNTGLS